LLACLLTVAAEQAVSINMHASNPRVSMQSFDFLMVLSLR